MGRVIALREDFDGPVLRGLAKASKDSNQSRRLLALAENYDGGRRKDAARIGVVGLQIIRDWVLRFNANGPAGLIDGKATGKPPKLNDAQRQALARIVESGPIPAVHGVVRWRRKDLALWIYEEYGISLEQSSVGRELRALGFVKISARPRHHGQNEFAIEDFKKNFPSELAKIRATLPVNTAIEIWWQDEARVGQKTKITRRWAKRGTRPRALKDQRTKSAWIFGAICPARGVGAALVLPRCNTQAMQWHLDEIATQVSPGAHAILIVDQAGWHTTAKLVIPPNITLLLLPPRAPELNPVENIWQFLRDNWLSNRIFKSYDEIVALCCDAWNNLTDQPWKIMSIGQRKWTMSSN
ncbi:MAG: IS630 family transposase [Erythrobacter sp.]|nr:IS630 family transposase [Erythrobacter sp.]